MGSLFFKDKVSHGVSELKRIKNTDELEDTFHVRDDIDSETFSTMFALTSDELMQLDKHNEITARLLTAGSVNVGFSRKGTRDSKSTHKRKDVESFRQ